MFSTGASAPNAAVYASAKAFAAGVSMLAKYPAEEKRFAELSAPMPARVFSSIRVPSRSA